MKNSVFKSSAKFVLPIFLLTVISTATLGNNGFSGDKDSTHLKKTRKIPSFDIREHLQVFYPLESNSTYSVAVCADLPVNDDPGKVYKKGEPGHVFLVLSKRNPATSQVVACSFGFYPRLPVSCLFKRVRSRIVDNSNREYDASIENIVSVEQFAVLLEKCIALTKKKYDLNRYNCYDYVLEAFNAMPGIEKLPVSKVKFPFIFGKGGSPCGLYRDLKKILATNSPQASRIKFGLSRSPRRNSHDNMIASFQ